PAADAVWSGPGVHGRIGDRPHRPRSGPPVRAAGHRPGAAAGVPQGGGGARAADPAVADCRHPAARRRPTGSCDQVTDPYCRQVPMRSNLVLTARLRALLGPDAAGVRQSLVALGLNSASSLVAGAFLGAITATLADFPGLLVLVPAAIGLRGNIFGAFGNRLSTSIHAGTFRWSLRREAVLGQNVLASMLLTMAISLA